MSASENVHPKDIGTVQATTVAVDTDTTAASGPHWKLPRQRQTTRAFSTKKMTRSGSLFSPPAGNVPPPPAGNVPPPPAGNGGGGGGGGGDDDDDDMMNLDDSIFE
ncbi:hypothetical protein LTR47_005704 [Exophiala xenobiotica]|nr:hypothetical protein LTR92_009704 [Exophiala xenobiotica]KAK5205007.1 hypothetical protein LTR41_009217 [Exophiala xenobiotica]KAK5220135.1 hypothetical protein LTR72_007666 [Exophiala xenobiotica]KAK5233207.1 hypothetical protein LTR47_005704 [Exophiala xenobiotica]KAK5250788.1 hypothetical protein LTS06_004496 [Exophiala xenobiotica]